MGGLTPENDERLRSFWSSTTCGDLVHGQSPIVIESTATVASACETLARHSILSALVQDPASRSFVGLFSYRSLIAYVLATFAPHDNPPPHIFPAAAPHAVVPRRDILARVAPSASVTEACRPVADIVRVAPAAPLVDAVRAFATGVHRVSVIDAEGKLWGTVSQKDVARFAGEKANGAEGVFARTLKDAGLGGKQPIAVPQHWRVLRGLEMLHLYKISSLAVVDFDGHLAGSLSLGDIKYLFARGDLSLLWMPIKDFEITRRSEEIAAASEDQDIYPYFAAQVDRPLSLALNKMVATGSRHLWVVNDARKPTGVVTMTDLFKALCPTPSLPNAKDPAATAAAASASASTEPRPAVVD